MTGSFPHPSLSPLQIETLTILAEEANEVAIECSKILRMGTDFCRRGRDVRNDTHLTTEIGDFTLLAAIASRLGLLDENVDPQIMMETKVAKLREWSNLGDLAAEVIA